MSRMTIVALTALVIGALPADAQTLAATGPAPVRTAPQARKSPTTARIIGLVPGAGHMYAGETGRGLAYLGGTIGILAVGTAMMAAACTDDLLDPQGDDDCGSARAETAMTIAILGYYGWTIYDAGRAAHRTNARRGLTTSLVLQPAVVARTSQRSIPGLRLGVSVRR